MVACLASEQSDVCPIAAPAQYSGSPSLEGYQVDSHHTGNLRSTVQSIP